jgi:hypothetical protein
MENTPANVISELKRIQSDSQKGVQALYDAEVKLAEAENSLDKAESLAFINAEGTVADRQALAKLESAPVRLERDIAKAEVNRVRTKLKVLESASIATATIARQVELQWRG